MDAPRTPADSLSAGATVGPYTVVSRIGSGGMGQVYRARDAKLDRDVAIKVLLPEFADDPERVSRFRREARILAALGHARIAAVYGLEDVAAATGASPALALAMELVEGPTLADRIGFGPLPLDDVLQIAAQIADGLEYAHEQGIVHRDLKPANIKVGPDDSVKILDFGLAKALDGEGTPAKISNSPTVTWMPTQGGVILGTAAYMSPEQARGKVVDRRADIWAFGCVLYEMMTGVAPFRGDTVTDILAAVVHKEPDWSRLPSNTPPRLRELLGRCLQKDVRQRVQAIGDARIALEDVRAHRGEVAAAGAPPGRLRWLGPALGGAAIVAALAGVAVWVRPATPSAGPRPVLRFRIALPPGQHLDGLGGRALALSSDGALLAYVARGASGPRQIYLRPLDTLESQAVAGTEGAEGPVLSPDGRWLVFFADGALKKVPLTGGVAEVLADATTGVKGAVWTNDRTVVFAPYASGLQEVPVSAGTPRPVSKFQTGETLHLWPTMLPSHRVLFAVFSIGGQTAFVSQALDGSARRDVLRAVGSMPVFVPPGHLLYAQNGTLMAVPFDADAESPRGDVPAQPVVKGVWEGGFTAQFTVSPSGTLAFAPGPVVATPMQLVLVDRDGTAHPLRAAPGFFNQPRLSPDGKHLLVDNVGAGDAMQVWSYDIAQDRMGPFTYGGVHRHAIWTADSRRVIFMSTGGGSSRIMWQAADGTGSPETLVNESDAAGVLTIPYAASSGVLTFTKLFPTKATELWAIPLPGQAPPAGAPSVPAKPFLETRTADGAAELSPDGHWLAYASDDDGHGREVFVRAYPGPGGPWQVSSGGGNEPKWNPKGGEIFYRQGTRMMAVDVATGPGFSAGKPHQLFEGDYVPTFGGYVRANYDVSSDGKTFLMLQPVTKERTLPTEIELVVNWSEELKRLLP